MEAHRCKQNYDANDMRVLTWVGIDTDDYMEEQESRENKVDIHKEMAGVISHQITEKIGEVENKERTIKERESSHRVIENY